MEIEKVIQEKVDSYIKGGLEEKIEESVTKMMGGIVEEVFRSYGDTAKQIKEAIEKSIDVNLERFKLADYNVLIAEVVNKQLVQSINENTVEPIKKLIHSMVGNVEKKQVKLSEIVDMFTQAAMEDADCAFSGEISLHIEFNEEHNWHDIAIDVDPDQDKKSCAINFLISGKDESIKGRIFHFRTQDSWRHSDGDVKTPAKLAQLSHLEMEVFRLYSAQVEVEIDEGMCSSYWERG